MGHGISPDTSIPHFTLRRSTDLISLTSVFINKMIDDSLRNNPEHNYDDNLIVKVIKLNTSVKIEILKCIKPLILHFSDFN